jgi:hypothetical protein
MVRHFDVDSNGFLDLDELVDMWFRKNREQRKVVAAQYDEERRKMWEGLDNIVEFKREQAIQKVIWGYL